MPPDRDEALKAAEVGKGLIGADSEAAFYSSESSERVEAGQRRVEVYLEGTTDLGEWDESIQAGERAESD